jgi:uncharacterized protein
MAPRPEGRVVRVAIRLAAVALGLAVAHPGTPRAEPSTKIKIAFAGDSIVDNYWEGITRVVDANACLKGRVELGRFAKNGSGLTRGDKVYWPREVRRIGDSFKPSLFVLSIGLNDRQFIVDGEGARTAWGAPNWTDKYREQIVAFIKSAAASNAQVLLVGLPAMRDSVDASDVEEKNKMFADAIAALGLSNVQYVEPWRLVAAGADRFASYGPDHNGRMVQIRTSDGQHFTVAGEDLVAAYLYPKIVTAFEHSGVRLDRVCESGTADAKADTKVETKVETKAETKPDTRTPGKN